MYAMLVQVEIDSARASEAEDLLHSMTVPMVKQAPGFVSGTWMRAADRSRGQSVVLFESEGTATAAAARIKDGPPAGAPVTVVLAEVFEVLAQA
jgi:hypothetical protein